MALAAVRSATARRKSKADASGAPTLQSLKSGQTRMRLVEATIRCIVKNGYSNTTTPQIANEAGLSRGAMLHHFENGAALIKAAIIELHEKRLRAFRRAADTGHGDPTTLVRTYWQQIQKPAFIAFHELALAARTHADLARMLNPLQVEFRERYMATAFSLFPEWAHHRKQFDLAMALSQNLLEGLAINVQTGATDPEMVEPMLELLENQIRAMNPALAKASS
ncbi:TetR/AcrR family transcriptional regulator [Sphingosinicella soli]|uniref:AcrR family transcriptional regulator n=1 Tax=Sphingosinicella soli TaxID=333708 RepID=A0A7W7F7A1_9SPHN|nr:TetR/AcrR family transcriptional regulator [Sphingosinicella soli]MBB4632407.1 AcrR family transcriptional regulator [Sphingosinicella soli]